MKNIKRRYISLNQIIENKNLFDYKNMVNSKIYEHSHLVFFFATNTAIIYYNDSNVGVFLRDNIDLYLEQIKKTYPKIEKLEIHYDKKAQILERNKKEKLNEEKEEKLNEEKEENLKIEKILKKEKISEIYKNIENLEDDKYKEYFKNLANIYIENYNGKNKICPNCLTKTEYIYKGKCFVCISQEYEEKLKKAVEEIKINPYLKNNSKAYIEARKILSNQKFNSIYRKFLKTSEETEEIKKELREYAIYLTASSEEKLIEYEIEKVKEIIIENIKKRIT